MPTAPTIEQAPPLLNAERLSALMRDWRLQSGKRLRDRRVMLGLSQVTLGNAAGVRPTAISKFELGIVVPKDSVRIALACALWCEVDDIWPTIERQLVWQIAREAA